MAGAVQVKDWRKGRNHKAAQSKTTDDQVDPPASGERNESAEEALTRSAYAGRALDFSDSRILRGLDWLRRVLRSHEVSVQ